MPKKAANSYSSSTGRPLKTKFLSKLLGDEVTNLLFLGGLNIAPRGTPILKGTLEQKKNLESRCCFFKVESIQLTQYKALRYIIRNETWAMLKVRNVFLYVGFHLCWDIGAKEEKSVQ